MCKIPNNQFLSVFTNENTSQFPQVQMVFSGNVDNILCIITVNVNGRDVIKEIDNIKSHKIFKEELHAPLIIFSIDQ